jgi:hypothetical protein
MDATRVLRPDLRWIRRAVSPLTRPIVVTVTRDGAMETRARASRGGPSGKARRGSRPARCPGIPRPQARVRTAGRLG